MDSPGTCSASSIAGCHPWQTGGLVGRVAYPFAEAQSVYSTVPVDRASYLKVMEELMREEMGIAK